MGIESLLKTIANLSRPELSGIQGSNSVPLPKAKADPLAAAEFAEKMQQGMAAENKISSAMVSNRPEAAAKDLSGHDIGMADIPQNAASRTLGERLASSRSERSEGSRTREWLEEVTDIFDKDTISHVDLYRVQVLAGLAHIEITRNSHFNKGMNDGLNNILKNN